MSASFAFDDAGPDLRGLSYAGDLQDLVLDNFKASAGELATDTKTTTPPATFLFLNSDLLSHSDLYV